MYPRPATRTPITASLDRAQVGGVPVSRCATVAAASRSQRDLVSLSLLLGPASRPRPTHRRA